MRAAPQKSSTVEQTPRSSPRSPGAAQSAQGGGVGWPPGHAINHTSSNEYTSARRYSYIYLLWYQVPTETLCTMRGLVLATLLASVDALAGARLAPGRPRVLVRYARPCIPTRVPHTMLAALPEPLVQELPSAALLKAIARCGSTATAADVAAEAGMDIAEARRQLLVLARLVGAELQVSERGELLFVFDEESTLRRSLRGASFRQRARDVWTTVSPPVMWTMRASFGLGLLASLTIVTVAVTALASSKDDSSSSRSVPSVGMLWGPSPLDFLYYSSRPYGYYGYGYGSSDEKGFLQSCFSLLFGDGDINANLEQRKSVAAAALIRAYGGTVTAEQCVAASARRPPPARSSPQPARPASDADSPLA